MKARIVSETADSVTHDYQHLTVSSWCGRVESSKAMFNRTYRLSPPPTEVNHVD